MNGDYGFPSYVTLPPRLGECIYCGHFLAEADMGNGLVALIPSSGVDGYYPQHDCSNRANPGNTHEVRE